MQLPSAQAGSPLPPVAPLAGRCRHARAFGAAQYAEALAAAESAAYEMEVPNVTGWALIELVEAAVRSRQPARARDALRRLSDHTIDGSDWTGGVEARSRALVSEGDAERWYVEAVERLGRTPFRTEQARAHLVYGEWLRPEGRRIDARQQLGPAYELFTAMRAEGFAERARMELRATGEKVRKRSQDADTHELTPQEAHIARLARDGRSNAEISAELFLSVRTVEWHLRKVFTKLEITRERASGTLWPRLAATRCRRLPDPRVSPRCRTAQTSTHH